jgi:hypothetical protein
MIDKNNCYRVIRIQAKHGKPGKKNPIVYFFSPVVKNTWGKACLCMVKGCMAALSTTLAPVPAKRKGVTDK